MSQTVTREIAVTTHKGKGTEVKFSATFVRPTSMDECISALRGEQNTVDFIGDVLEAKAFGAGKARLYNYALTGDEDTQDARNKALSGAISAVSDYTYSARGESVKAKAEKLDEMKALLSSGASLEDIRAKLGL